MIAQNVANESENTKAKTTADAERLVAELRERAGVDQAAVGVAEPVVLRQTRRGEQAARERAPDAGEAVRGERADRVVDLLVDRVDGERDDHARDAADDRRRPQLDVARRRRDGHERGDRAVAGHADVDRLRLPVRGADGGQHAGGGRHLGDER